MEELRFKLRQLGSVAHVLNSQQDDLNIVVVQLLGPVWLFVNPWTAAYQAPLFFTISQSLLKLISLSRWCHPTISYTVVPFSSRLQSFPASGFFLMSPLFASGDQSIGASASVSVLPKNIQGWFPLGLTGLILLSKGLSSLLQHHSSKASNIIKNVKTESIPFLKKIERIMIYWTWSHQPWSQAFSWYFSNIWENMRRKTLLFLQNHFSLSPNLY